MAELLEEREKCLSEMKYRQPVRRGEGEEVLVVIITSARGQRESVTPAIDYLLSGRNGSAELRLKLVQQVVELLAIQTTVGDSV